MNDIEQILNNNQQWAETIKQEQPDFFAQLAKGQSPKYLYIGCSDSRAPVEQLMGLNSGDIFVHRNVGNVVAHNDLSVLSVIQFAVETLKVEHIIVTGHYGCGGVEASVDGSELGMMDNWLRYIRDVYVKHQDELDAIEEREARYNKLCELNVIEQVANLCNTSPVRQAWNRGQKLSVYGLIYSIAEGRLHNLNVTVDETYADFTPRLSASA